VKYGSHALEPLWCAPMTTPTVKHLTPYIYSSSELISNQFLTTPNFLCLAPTL